ncbi:hemolysin family protein [Rhodococcus aetherivorans]|uniref:Hemolysin family protein n=1 Tax=Rhodococcus aetherivorans TaxID=191292 RepID=A0AA46SAM4_9NOCA|nr:MULTISPECIES: hemolysin family protein [Rhodococcus]UGQ41365.1 hemolysin family protein [Rhodococcus aetherivorans]USC15357.1 hemolysin family protein [Rhodococcus sp. 11-3]UYF94473.1 hemolysin family protein [Rhodococcus aetherivorans]WFS11787.1 hemolysin family protein [Rhodococcus aetherivorans]
MTGSALVDILLVLVFVLIGGVFAGTELALVSLRESQIRALEERGRRGRRTAALAKDPNRFLSAVQIGVTVAGFFSAAYGASTIAPNLAPALESWGLPAAAASAAALIGTTLVIAYLSLVLGELVPKRIALQRATGVSLLTAPALDRFATLMRPVIRLLSVSTDGLVRLLGADPARRSEEITHEELRELLLGHSAVPEDERTVLAEVFDAGQRSLLEVMRPRTEVDFLPADTAIPAAREQALAGTHSRYPVVGSSLDDVVGFVHLRDLLLADPANASTVADVCRPILSLPGSKPALATLSLMRRNNDQIALVVDEYGGTAGIATLEDIVEEIVGEIGDEFEPTEQASVTPAPAQPDTQQVDGLLIVEDFERATGIGLPDGPYETVAGCMLHRLQRLPRLGDSITVDGHRLTVSELDGRRIARLRLTPEG